jgi:hypothetical protein
MKSPHHAGASVTVPLLFLVAHSLPLLADFQPSTWQYRKRLPVDPGKPISSVHIDRQIYARAAGDLADLRIVRGVEEVPHLITRMSGSREARRVDAEVLDRSAAGDTVQVVLSLPGSAERHSRVTLTTTEVNFKKRVKLEASADRKAWALVRKEAYIFDFTHEAQHSSILHVDYPVSTRRFLRLTVEGWQDPAVLTGAYVTLAEDRPAVRQVMQEFASPAGTAEEKTKSVVYELDFGGAGIPKDLLRFEIDPAAAPAFFHRAVDIEVSEDKSKGWIPHGRGVLYRVTDEQSLWVQIPEARHRHMKVRVFHGDDKPLGLKSILAESVLRRVIFPVTAGGDYWVYYGNVKAKRPSYDLPMVLAKSSMESAATINAAAEETNPGYVEPPPPVKPFSDRYPGVLYGALGVAVLVIGYMTVRFIQKASSSSAQSSS